MAAKLTATIQRSRRRTSSVRDVPSTTISGRPMPNHAMIVEVKVCKLPVAGLQIELYVSLRRRRAAANFGNFVFEAVRQVDTRPVLLSSHRILDRLPLALDPNKNQVSAPASLRIHLELYLRQHPRIP